MLSNVAKRTICMIFVTGCAGFIGSHLCEELVKAGKAVVGVDNFDPYYPKALKVKNLEWLLKQKNFTFHEISILDENCAPLLKGAETVYHLAAIAGVRNSLNNPLKYIHTNVIGTARIFDAARVFGIKKVVFSSSSSVYGEVPKAESPIKESHKLNPISPYGASKLMAEEIADMYAKTYGIKTAYVRYFTVYGPRQRPDEALAKFISKALKRETIEIYGDGNQTRDFTYVMDAVAGTVLAGERGSGAYNLAGGKSFILNEVLEIMKNVLGCPLNIRYVDKQTGDVANTYADISKAKKELGYVPKTPLEDGIRAQMEWIKKSN